MAETHRYDAVIFDLDGTLIGTRRLYLECYRRAVHDTVGTLYSDEELLARRPRSEFRFLLELGGEAASPAVLDAFYCHYESLHPELYEGVFSGVPETLARLREKGLGLGLVTGKSRRAWEITRRLGNLEDWDVIVLDDDVDAPKPHPQGILAALEALGAEPARAIYVGDTLSDVEAAHAAGADAAAVLWSHEAGHRERVAARAREAGAHVLARPSEILDLVLSDSSADDNRMGGYVSGWDW